MENRNFLNVKSVLSYCGMRLPKKKFIIFILMHSENIAKHEPPMISVALYALKTKEKRK